MIETIAYKGAVYPKLQSIGHASQWCAPFADEILKGCKHIVDIGCMKKEWALPGAVAVDIDFNDHYDAMNLPDEMFDGIFSSHCLEHIPNYVHALEYWHYRLEPGGVLFMYLPHPSQEYWKPHHNRKHIHSLNPSLIKEILVHLGFIKVFVTEGYDLNHSFYAIAEKRR